MTIASTNTIDLVVTSGQTNLMTGPIDDQALDSTAELNGELGIGISAKRPDES